MINKNDNLIKENMSYDEKKAFFSSLLTVYGRKPVLEAITNPDITPYRLHLAETNKAGGIINDILAHAEKRQLDVRYHSRKALSHISKNSKQDQGVVLDIKAPAYKPIEELHFESIAKTSCQDLIALENVTNPQNVGMTIRSVGASPCQGIIIPKKGNANFDALLIKASAGTALKVPIYHCQSALEGMMKLKKQGFRLVGLSSYGTQAISNIATDVPTIFIFGNESIGLSQEMQSLCDELVQIPLHNDVESLNVCVAASIVAFRTIFT